jgi:transcriptional regulator with XRE-family HTH domain
MPIMTQLIGARLKSLREQRNLSQDDFARLFGFKDRQTVSTIEAGEGRISAEELMLAVEKLGRPLDYFTDPFMLVGDGKFSWRQTNVSAPRLDAYERSAGRWIAAFRTLAPQAGRAAPLLRRALGLRIPARINATPKKGRNGGIQSQPQASSAHLFLREP